MTHDSKKEKTLRLLAVGGALLIVLLFIASIIATTAEINSLATGKNLGGLAKMLNRVLNGTKIKRELSSFNSQIIVATVVLLLLSLLLIFTFFATPVFSVSNDTFQANVTVNNAVPSVSNVNLNDSNGGTIQLMVSNFTTVKCNATITDLNGWSDISSANATVFYSNDSNNKSDSPNDINYHYTNSSCTLFGGSGTTVFANCTVNLSFAAVNGTWTCNVSANDTSNVRNSSNGTNIVDQLVAIAVWNNSINFSAMNNGENTTLAGARGVNVSNEGNTMVDIAVKALTASMSCVTSGSGCVGAIGVGNLSFNTTQDTYDNLRAQGFNLTTTNQTMPAWDLYPKGINTADTVNSTKYLWWGIQIPQAVKGEFNVNITISALLG
jgi:hypothetical protein